MGVRSRDGVCGAAIVSSCKAGRDGERKEAAGGNLYFNLRWSSTRTGKSNGKTSLHSSKIDCFKKQELAMMLI